MQWFPSGCDDRRYVQLHGDCTAAVFTKENRFTYKVTRDLNEGERESVSALANTDAFQQSRRERKEVEMRFAHMKRILKLDRLRLWGLSGARDEVLLTVTAQNLRRIAKLFLSSATTGYSVPSVSVEAKAKGLGSPQ
jgi:hypothetical protein